MRNEYLHPAARALETHRGKVIAESRVSQEVQVHRSAQVHRSGTGAQIRTGAQIWHRYTDKHRHMDWHRCTDGHRHMDQEQVHGSSTVGGLYNPM